MSLIKAADVPKHMADRLRSRRIAARLAGVGGKPVVPAKYGCGHTCCPDGSARDLNGRCTTNDLRSVPQDSRERLPPCRETESRRDG